MMIMSAAGQCQWMDKGDDLTVLCCVVVWCVAGQGQATAWGCGGGQVTGT